MKPRRKFFPARWFGMFLLLAPSAAHADDRLAETESAAAAAFELRQTVAELVSDLDSNEFQTRQDATKKLTALGAEALPALLREMRSATLEVKSRILLVLESGLTAEPIPSEKPTPPVVGQSAEALETLAAERADPVGQRALRVLERNSEIREELTLRKLQDLGGIVGRLPAEPERTPRVVPQAKIAARANIRQSAFLTLGKTWKGNVAGIQLLERIEDTYFNVYIINYPETGSALSEDEEAALQRIFAASRIQYRGEAHLGVVGDNLSPNRCRISRVAEGKAAAQAGLQSGDYVLEFDGDAVGGFRSLVDLIEQRRAGQTVDVLIQRGTEKMTLQVTLGHWTKP